MNKILIGVIAFALWTGTVFLYGDSHGLKKLAVKVNAATIAATKKAREEEQIKQEKVNAIAKKQYEDISGINATLVNDIAGLHERESRRNVSEATELRCKGATGADLSKSDAEFLIRLAARADKIRIGLRSCYDYADEVVKEK